jgi:hypothetical protein
MPNICRVCGANTDVVGRAHRCIARPEPMAKTDMAKTGVAKVDMAKKAGSTYRYRDPEKRRAYQRELMRKRYHANSTT